MHPSFEVLRHFSHDCELLLGVLVQVQRNNNVVVACLANGTRLGDDERHRTFSYNLQCSTARDELQALKAVGPHDDQVGVHFDGNIVDVIEQVANSHRRFCRTVKIFEQIGCKCIEPFSGFAKFILFGHNVHEMEFAAQCISDGNGVVHSIGRCWGEIHWYEDAMLRHAPKIDRSLAGSLTREHACRNLAVLLNLKSLK